MVLQSSSLSSLNLQQVVIEVPQVQCTTTKRTSSTVSSGIECRKKNANVGNAYYGIFVNVHLVGHDYDSGSES